MINLLNDKRIFLIDSFLYIFKYYFYYKKFFKYNYILIGFFNFILDILIKNKPTYIVAIFDSKLKKNKKKKFFLNYKCNRKKIPKEIINSIPIIKKILKLLNIQIFNLKYYEADDIIGSIIKIYEKKGYINYIITEDKDYYQLISNKTFILNFKNKKCINIKFILNKYKINNIKKIIDYFSIIGDKSDNIPGIPNIGIIKANKLLNKYKNIKSFYYKKNVKYIENILKIKIKKYKYLAKISRKLFKINTNIKIKKKISFFYRKKINIKIIKNIYFNINKKFFKKKINKLKFNFL
ncbi:MAG: DNA polymerase I [Candidatus Shikimatogenerans bostrichidophilus]|nr:MAG: DNA polymerase I [Candidatus Shikimatogenerans bostrichidophilus]